MAIIDQLKTSRLGLKGANLPRNPDSDATSKLHFEASINNMPSLKSLPFKFQKNLISSQLDINGKTPEQYIQHLPG